jgi:hypothetical protein
MMSRKSRQLLIHIIGSLLFLSLPVIFSPDVSEFFLMLQIPPFQRDFISFVLLLMFFYAHYYWLLPEFYFKKRYIWYGAGLILALVIITYLPHLLVPHHFFRHPHGPEEFGEEPRHRRIEFLFAFREHFFQFLIVIVFSFFLKLNTRLKLAQKEKLDAELSYLKAQINPHFLFNTLNGIYSTAVSEGAADTANAVVQLSGMMRYVTSEAERDYVSLDKEIEYISSYVELQRVRLGNTVKIDYSVKGINHGKKISPLILIPFVENAFKYGVNPEKPSHISIDIEIAGDVLILSVENNKVKKNLSEEERTGMGIENTMGRLEHLYPYKHEMKIDEDSEKFHLVLKIDLG